MKSKTASQRVAGRRRVAQFYFAQFFSPGDLKW